MCNGIFDHWLRRTIENLCHSIVSDGCSPKSTTIPLPPSFTFEPFIQWQWWLWNQRWLKWKKCKCAPDDSRKTEGKLILCKMKSSSQDSTSLFACVTRYIRRCQWILTRNEWWYTFTLANFRGDEGSGRVGRQGQGLSSHQFCPGSQQSTMAGIQRFNQSVNKEVPPKPISHLFVVSISLQLLLDWAGSVLSASLHLIIHVPVWLSQFQQKMLLLQVLVISNMTNRE